MSGTILITGATDGIGLETIKLLRSTGANLLLHGRNGRKLEAVADEIITQPGEGDVQTFIADLSRLSDVVALADAVVKKHNNLDVLINNAGVYASADPILDNGLDVRFVVNTLAPYLLTRRLLPLLKKYSRVINLSSAAQSTIDLTALVGERKLTDSDAYAQSKLALTIWSAALARDVQTTGCIIVAVNPGSMLGSKMVKDAYGVDGGDLRIGAEILVRAALSDEFATASGKYFDNDRGAFAAPHSDALDEKNSRQVLSVIDSLVSDYLA